MSDDPDAIPEREMKDFQFRQMRKIRVFDSPDDMPRERSSLLAISSKFGLTFVGLDTTLKVFHTHDIIAANKIDGPNDEIVDGVKSLSVPVDLPIHHLALSSDDLTLSVCGTSNDERPLLAFFDIRTFLNKTRLDKGPFASMRLAVAAGTAVQDLKWNPLQCSVLAACLSDGSMLVLDVMDSATVLAQLPASAGITCLCWSPKGKQVAAGKQNATVIQYTPALQEKKVIPCPPFYTSDNPVKVLDVLWLSTFGFAVVYAAADGSPETPPELVVVSLPKKDEKRPEAYMNFNDPVYGSCPDRQHHYFLTHIEDWDLVLAASAASIEVSIIAKQEDKTNWELWLLEDASRAELPVTLNSDDTLPLGVAVDYTNQEEIQISDEKTLPPAPILMLLSTDGVLCPFSLLNTNPGVRQLVSAPANLALDGERLPSAGSVAAPPPSAALGSALVAALRPPATSTPTPAPAAPAAASLGFSFATPTPQTPAPSGFSLGSSAAGVPPGLSLGSAGFSFSGLTAKPAAEPAPSASAFAFSTPSAKPPAETAPAPAPSPAPGPAPPRLATASPVPVFKLPAEPATPAVKVNLSDRFSAAETPAAPTLQQFSFASASTSTPKPAFLPPGNQPAPLPSNSKPARASAPVQPASAPSQPASTPGQLTRSAQSSPAPTAVRTATPTQGPSSTPVPQAALSIKALQQRKDADPIMTGILDEIAHFQKELDELKARSDRAEFKVGTNTEMQDLRKASDDLHVFALEIKETTESLHGDISSLKTTLLEGFAGAEDAKSQSELNRDRDYLQLLYKKPLDPRSEDQLKEIRRLYQYVKFAVEDVNDVLDMEWEKHLEKKRKQRHLIIPEREALFTALSNNLDIIHQQERKLETLTKTLRSLRLYGTASSWATPRRPSPTPSQQSLDNELETLRETLLKASLEPAIQTPSKSPAKMSPSKQAQLRNFLSKRQTPPVRSTAPANLSRSAFLSPKYYEDLDEVSSASSLSQPMDPEEEEPQVEEEEELAPPPAPAPAPAPTLPRHPTVVRTPSIQPTGFGAPSSLFGKVSTGLTPAITPVLGGKISVSGADSTAFATKTVKHGAPPTERAPPVTVPAQQAAANAALRRQMANQKPAVSASLTESTLKTVPQVVNVQELNERGPPIPVSAVISAMSGTTHFTHRARDKTSSSTSPVPVNPALPTNQAKRNSIQGPLKVPGPASEGSVSPQPGFVFASSSSGPSLPEQTSKAFSFAAASAGSFTFTSLSAPTAAAPSQGGVASQGKDVAQPSKFSFGTPGGKAVFGPPGEAPFSFTPKSGSPALGRTSTPTPPPSMSAEPAKAAPLGGALRVEPHPRTGATGETLGSFSGLRVGPGEEDRPRPASTGFSFAPPAEFSFGAAAAFQTDPPTAVSSASVFKPPPPSSSPALSLSALLAAPLPEPPVATAPSPVAVAEDPSPAPPAATETPPPAAAETPPPVAAESPPPPHPSAVSPAPPAETPPPTEESATPTPPPSQSVTEETVAVVAEVPEEPPTPPAPTPSPPAAPAAVTPPTEAAPESSATPEPPVTTATETASDPASAAQPGSIFTQPVEVPPATVPAVTVPAATVPAPTVSTDSTTLAFTTLTTAITTVASDSAPTQETTPTPAQTPGPVTTAVTTATVFGQPAPAAAPASAADPPSAPAAPGFGSGFGSAPGGGFSKPAFGVPSGFGQSASGFSFGQSSFGTAPAFGQPSATPPASSSAGGAVSAGGGGLFGTSSTSAPGSFSFGQLTTSGGSTTPGSAPTGLFGQGATPAFGQQSSVFGSNTTTTSSSGFSFNQPSAFGSTPTPSVFGQATPGTVFGQAGSTPGLFGSGAGGAAPSAGAGGGFFSGLGGKPSEDAANKNPFGSTASGGFGQANQAGSSSLFGNSGAKAFGFGTSSFGEPKPSGTFSTGVGSVAAQGFGSFTSPAKTGGFGSAPVFGSPPAFGGSPSFGGASAFGAAPSFSSPLAPATGKVFGEGTAAANVGGFGFASAPNAPSFGGLASQSAPSFGSLANQNPPSFGSLAQQGSGFGSQTQGFSGFGSSGAFSGGGFGAANQQNPQWPGLQ